ncbi:MAG: helix-turn-helix domain-containing protein [Candidatus Dormibacteraceae bacterium]
MNEEKEKKIVDLPVELLRSEEVARILGVSRTKAYEMMASGRLPVVRFDRTVRVPMGRLREWIANRTIWENPDLAEIA